MSRLARWALSAIVFVCLAISPLYALDLRGPSGGGGMGAGDALTSNPLSQFAATTSAQLLATLTNPTGTGLAVFATAPTFTTNLTSPLVIGGTAVGSTLTLKSTGGVGTTDAIIFQVGNNGGTEAGRFLDNGHLRLGGSSDLGFATINDSTNFQTNLYVNKTVTGDLGGVSTASFGERIFMVNTATNPASAYNITTEAQRVNVIHGSASVQAVGTSIGLNVGVQVLGSDNLGATFSEYAPYIGVTRVDLGTGYARNDLTGNIWLFDGGTHTGIANQPNTVQGYVSFQNNYYNGSPLTAASCAFCAVTYPGTGTAADATHAAATTYANDVAVLITGRSGVPGVHTGVGWTEGIRVGGSGPGWNPAGGSRIGTGIHVQDFETYGILIDGRTAASTGPALRVNDTGVTAVHIGPSGTPTNLVEIISNTAGSPAGMFRVQTTTSAIRNKVTFESASNVELAFLRTSTQAYVLGLDVNDANAFKMTATDNAFASGWLTRLHATQRWTVIPPATQPVAATDTIAATACGTIKNISSASAVTTNTTDTFTAPAAANAGCRMTVCNVNATDAITLDKNANFLSTAGADVILLANTCIDVISTGASGVWRQVTGLQTST